MLMLNKVIDKQIEHSHKQLNHQGQCSCKQSTCFKQLDPVESASCFGVSILCNTPFLVPLRVLPFWPMHFLDMFMHIYATDPEYFHYA